MQTSHYQGHMSGFVRYHVTGWLYHGTASRIMSSRAHYDMVWHQSYIHIVFPTKWNSLNGYSLNHDQVAVDTRLWCWPRVLKGDVEDVNLSTLGQDRGQISSTESSSQDIITLFCYTGVRAGGCNNNGGDKLVHSVTKLFKHTEQNISTKRIYMKNILRLVMICIYTLLIKPGYSYIFRNMVR